MIATTTPRILTKGIDDKLMAFPLLINEGSLLLFGRPDQDVKITDLAKSDGDHVHHDTLNLYMPTEAHLDAEDVIKYTVPVTSIRHFFVMSGDVRTDATTNEKSDGLIYVFQTADRTFNMHATVRSVESNDCREAFQRDFDKALSNSGSIKI